MAFKLRIETLEQRETPAGIDPVDPITGLPIIVPPPSQVPPPGTPHPNHPFEPGTFPPIPLDLPR